MARKSKRAHNQSNQTNMHGNGDLVDKVKIGRLAMRQVRDMYVAYYTMPDTMHEAVFLGEVKMKFIEGHTERRDAFISLMRECVSDLIEETVGVRPEWPEGPKSAPFWEKTDEAAPGEQR